MASLYDMSIVMFTRSLQNLDGILTKAESHAQSNGMSLDGLVEGRLAPDMFPLPFQICAACDTAKFVAVRVGGIANTPQDDNEKTFEELHKRIAATLEYLGNVKREDIDGKHADEVMFRDHKFTGQSYCIYWAIPNFYFHVVTAYDILRSKGVQIGKTDYLGKYPLPSRNVRWMD
jgi:uncharacterized protein